MGVIWGGDDNLELGVAIAIAVDKILGRLGERRCGNEDKLKGTGIPKMSWEVKCTKIRGHIGKHSDGASEWSDDG